MDSEICRHSCLIICPGIHDPHLTQDFLVGLFGNQTEIGSQKVLIFPAQDYPAYCAIYILQFLQSHHGLFAVPLVFISFSAGVVGAIASAWGWQLLGGKVKRLIAVDGWGVPLFGNFPIHRISHDYFTHWSSGLLGTGEDSFYADPPIEHLDLWRSPDTCQGWWVRSLKECKSQQRTFTTAAQFVNNLLQFDV
jgi:hypothetical protein